MHNNLNTLKMKRILELRLFIPNANRLNIWQLNCLSHQLNGNLSKYNIKSEMRSFKSNENIPKKEGGSYYVVSANKASSVTL